MSKDAPEITRQAAQKLLAMRTQRGKHMSFDGLPPERREHLLRVASVGLKRCSEGASSEEVAKAIFVFEHPGRAMISKPAWHSCVQDAEMLCALYRANKLARP